MRGTELGKDRTPGCCSCTCQSCRVLLRGQSATKRIDISGQGQEQPGKEGGWVSRWSPLCSALRAP